MLVRVFEEYFIIDDEEGSGPRPRKGKELSAGSLQSPDVDEAMREVKVEQIQTAIRGRKPAEEKLGLEDFEWEIDGEGRAQDVICPHGQRVGVRAGRGENRYLAYFDSAICGGCVFADRCPAEALKRNPRHVLCFSQREIDLGLRRKRCADLRGSRRNPRAAAESTMHLIKHPFGMGKVPIRGKSRVSMMVIGSAAMTNIRRIQRYQEKLREEKRKASAVPRQMEEAIQNGFLSS